MNNRLKELRKELGLSQKDFGDKILISKDHISSLETGRRSFTERIIRDICSKFHVNEDWLVNGKGNKFTDLTNNIDAPEYIKDMLRKFLTLSKSDRRKMEHILDSFIEEEMKKDEE
jgi:transcriptional regulator with XRE-family HTH domain